MRISDITEDTYGSKDYKEVKAKQDKERKERQDKSKRIEW